MKLYLKYASIILRSQMQYKASFALTAVGQLLVSFTGFLGVYYMFSRFNSVNGFTLSQVLLCFGVLLASFSLAECFVRGFDAFRGIISNGEFDRIMVRPRNEILQVLAARIEFTRIGRLLVSVGLLSYAVSNSGVVWTADKILTLFFMIFGGFFVYSGLFVIYASICFFTIEGLEFMNIFTDGTREFGKYPLSIYGEGVLKFLTYVIPIALFQYYPFLYLIGQSQNKLYMFLPLIAALFVFPCLLFWKFGVKHYKSTGS
ncbi:MAG TPA: ABC-2 family transporter protein [Oscillospiraceae bacterium]|nr:ABC-2 family transporter protein [Oscillospiraceae bacterium]HPF55185.1 ABC-2 family transporter protein [Clostridiales bacterium]HPK36502.1 ABC-2 family transporter protein [Oscillospiraceae bacterium]HPR75735.1 ABC-2 family transporter protein [Oscillospiraceae bacterium]